MWKSIVVEPAKSVLSQAGIFFSSLAGVVVILAIGWIIAKIIRGIATKILKFLDGWAETAKIDDILAKGGIKYSLSELIGVIFYWLVILATLAVAINIAGVTVAVDLLNKIILYIPNVIAAIIILVLGGFAAKLLSNIVQTTTANIGLEEPRLLAKIVEVVVIVFAVVVSLEQLKIGTFVVGPAALIILASVGLAVGLSFGLGCKDIAGKFMHDLLEKVKSKK